MTEDNEELTQTLMTDEYDPSTTQTMACAFIACVCFPVLGWIPLFFTCE